MVSSSGPNASEPRGSGARMRPSDAMEGVVEQYLKKSAKPNGFFEEVEAFTAAVDWSERWLQCLLGLYVVVVLLAFLTRKQW
eukprot:CAMPEP_0197540826 /NCGR_PEP_ID=MMETSP1318-20131121/66818_1 /TAXON_ID=552666 /ORGANISM="Partenskyella glossopodia, Strain RCC365" /LENGTH=81 /DNA_ID=CAMNT_0043099929 /DNA_START=1 /DNA_END=243 /DNA_ORIENTATION=+